MKTFILSIAVLLIAGAASAQIRSVSIQASGLTCSMCSNAINKALKTLDFVENVKPDIQTSSFEISFKPDASVDFDKLRNKVEGAGFFVSKFIAVIAFSNVQVKANAPVTVGDKSFLFINAESTMLNGIKQVRLLNKGFVSAKEFKKSGLADIPGGQKLYHAAI